MSTSKFTAGPSMPKVRAPAPIVLDSYNLPHINTTITAGDTVLMKAEEVEQPPYVAKVMKIENHNGGMRVHVRWYYRPDEAEGGRREFHGSKELFYSDHSDVQSVDTIEGKCVVHSLDEYMQLTTVALEDYFSRFDYNVTTKAITNRTSTPDCVEVYCKCELPYNPDKYMVSCDRCEDWLHPECINLL